MNNSSVTQISQQETDIQARLDFEIIISELSSEFINLGIDDIDLQVTRALMRIGAHMHVDRVFLFQFNPPRTEFTITHLWESPGTSKDETVRGVVVKIFFPWLSLSLIEGRDIIVNDSVELDRDETRCEYDYCRRIGIQSFVILPIQVEGEPLCAIGLDALHVKRQWSPMIIERLRLLGEIFANAIARKKSEELFRKSCYEIKQLKEQLEAYNDGLRAEIKLEHDFENIIGNSDAIKYILSRVEQITDTDATVLVTGETGTGKELIVRAIHEKSSRAHRPLIKVNCAAIPETLIESELFGHVKGAFTDARSKKPGRFELADKATLFLDEIGEMPLALQSKLLQFVEYGEFAPLGGTQTLSTDVRIIVATNRNLENEVKKGTFREDLWYRINVFPITVPPLRQRLDDIALLVHCFVAACNKHYGKSVTIIPESCLQDLRNHSWPGNVRELKHVVERAVLSSSTDVLVLDGCYKSPKPAALKTIQSLAEMERQHIVLALNATGWKVEGSAGAAERLDINPATLRSRMKKLGITKPAISTPL
jgi:formate hydrogenlyase transcriptional activator